MSEWVDVFEGIIGVITGLLVGRLLENLGDLNFYFSNFRARSYKPDNFGGFHALELSESSTNGTIYFDLFIYNKSNSHKVIKDVEIFIKSSKHKYRIKLDEGNAFQAIPIDYLSLTPKEIIRKNLKFSLNNYSIKTFVNDDISIYLIGKKLYGIFPFGINRNLRKKIVTLKNGKTSKEQILLSQKASLESMGIKEI